MTYSKTGNKKVRRQSLQRVKTPEWAILKRLPPHFFVVGRLTASFSLGAMTGVRTVSRNKSVISWACEPPHLTFCFQRFGFPGLYPGGVSEKGGRVSLTETGRFLPVFAASLHYVLTFVTFEGRNITQRSVNSMLKSVFSDLCVDYATENDTVVLRSPVKPGMI